MKHTTTYTLCMKLIAAGRTEGLMEKADVYFAAGRVTPEEYRELAAVLGG